MTHRRTGLTALCLLTLASVAATSAPPVGDVQDRILLNPLAEVSLDSLSGFRDRPLFVPNRRPPAPVVAAIEPEPEPESLPEPEPVDTEPEVPAVKLAGILQIESDSVAVLRDDGAGTTLSVRVGDPVESWTVAAIGNASVTLELDGREHEIRIFEPGDSAPYPMAPAMGGEEEEFGQPEVRPEGFPNDMPAGFGRDRKGRPVTSAGFDDGLDDAGDVSDGSDVSDADGDGFQDGSEEVFTDEELDADVVDESEAVEPYEGMDPSAIDGSGG